MINHITSSAPSADQLNALAHQIAYTAARGDIESMLPCTVKALPDSQYPFRWFDKSSTLKETGERVSVANALLYLGERDLLKHYPGEPWLVRVLEEPTGQRLELLPLAKGAARA